MASAAPAPSPVDAYKRQANEVLDMIDEKLSVYPIVQQVAAKTTLRPSHLTLAAMSLLIAFVWWGFGGRLFSNLVGFGWPLWESFHSLKVKEAPGEVDEEDTQWLTYWVVYSVFTLVESGTSVLELWIPMYHLVKIVFLLWCMLPQTRGALIIYNVVIEPILVRYEGKIDATHRKVRSSASTVAQDLGSAADQAIDSKKRELVDDAIASMVGHRKQASQAAPAAAAAGEAAAAPGGPQEVDDDIDSDHSKSQ